LSASNIQLELSEPWMVDTASSSFPIFTECGTGINTAPKCAVKQPTAAPTTSSTTVLAKDYSTGTTVKPFVSATTMSHSPVETPSVPSSSTATPSTAPPLTTPPADCTVRGTPCFVYLGAGLGALTVIVLLLIVIVIVLVFISVRSRKKRRKGERKAALQ